MFIPASYAPRARRRLVLLLVGTCPAADSDLEPVRMQLYSGLHDIVARKVCSLLW